MSWSILALLCKQPHCPSTELPSPSQSQTLNPLNVTPLPLPFSGNHLLLSISMDSATLGTSYKRSHTIFFLCSVQFSSITQLCLTLCDPMNRSTPGLSVHHQLPEFTPTHVHWLGDAIQPSHPLLSPSLPAFNLSQHQGLFQWVSSLHQVANVLEFQLQHQSFQWIFRTDFL